MGDMGDLLNRITIQMQPMLHEIVTEIKKENREKILI
jgi:hypothetical protein